MAIVTRFAPSPTGALHLGHAYAAFRAFDLATAAAGRFLVRLEDLDLGRTREAFVDAIFEDLGWLGLSWEQPVRRQSEHFPTYESALTKLAERDLLYPCFCTRKTIAAEGARAAQAPHGPHGALYPGTCRSLSQAERDARIRDGLPFVLRLDCTRALAAVSKPLTFIEEGRGPHGEHGLIHARPDAFGDVVLARKDTPASYHLCVAVDDAVQGITLVTRGNDLFEATALHRLLQTLLGLPEPRYHHHPLVRDSAGRRLAKRDASLSLRTLRAEGKTPDDLRRTLADIAL